MFARAIRCADHIAPWKLNIEGNPESKRPTNRQFDRSIARKLFVMEKIFFSATTKSIVCNQWKSHLRRIITRTRVKWKSWCTVTETETENRAKKGAARERRREAEKERLSRGSTPASFVSFWSASVSGYHRCLLPQSRLGELEVLLGMEPCSPRPFLPSLGSPNLDQTGRKRRFRFVGHFGIF